MKIISFSLYGMDQKYWVGAVKNIQLAQEHYPDWVCRFYIPFGTGNYPHAMSLEIHERARKAPDGIPPMFSRFLVADDPAVERFIVRDCDSRISRREALAVQEWEQSGMPLHSMADHPAHCRPLNGGLWGAVGGCLPNMRTLITNWMEQLGRPFQYGDDQDFLGQMIWPQFENHCLRHGLACGYPNVKPFPIPREGYRFVGEVYEADGTPRARDWEAIQPNSP